ncbi:uncharacterized protein LOC135840931 [Planococcus citri]|uniref:uncharacterized protein LOC135840931 n=1 Tax=Planococcus citri TaxID=170843 RepID=UPI0031F8E857
MLNFMCKCFLTILLSLAISDASENEHEALYFGQHVPRIMIDPKQLAKLKDPLINVPMATACPAKSTEERTFDDIGSIGKNSLFVREIYAKDHRADEVDHKICEDSYKLSLIYNANLDQFEFGFEIYYDKSKFKNSDFVDSIRSRYDMITNTHSIKNHVKTAISYMPNVPPVPFLSRLSSFPGASRIFQEAKIYLNDTRQTELGFLWIESFFTKYNYQQNHAVQTTYNVLVPSITWKSHECDDFNLGNGYFKNTDIVDLYNKLYNEDNQRRMLEGIRVPTSQPNDEYKEAACESENECFTKWLSIPSSQFQIISAKPVSCSNLLTVPIWKSTVEKVLNKLDNFLYAVSLILGRLTIHSGVHGTLQLPIQSDPNKRTKKITLGGKYMPVPDIIYKLVKYQRSTCTKPAEHNQHNDNDGVDNDDGGKDDDDDDDDVDDDVDESKEEKCVTSLGAMIVVIHNNPYFNEETDKVCKDQCEDLGWEEIQKINSAEGKPESKSYIYCCKTTDPEVRKKLGINYNFPDEIEYNPNIESTSALSLKSIPVFNFETHHFDQQNVYDFVLYVYRVMFEGVKFEPEKFILMQHKHEASTEKKNVESTENDLTGASVVQNGHNEIADLQIVEPENKVDGPDNSELQFDEDDEKESEKSPEQATDSVSNLTQEGLRQRQPEHSDPKIPKTQLNDEGERKNLAGGNAEKKIE